MTSTVYRSPVLAGKYHVAIEKKVCSVQLNGRHMMADGSPADDSVVSVSC